MSLSYLVLFVFLSLLLDSVLSEKEEERKVDILLQEIQALEESIQMQQQKVKLLESLRIEYLKGNRFLILS